MCDPVDHDDASGNEDKAHEVLNIVEMSAKNSSC